MVHGSHGFLDSGLWLTLFFEIISAHEMSCIPQSCTSSQAVMTLYGSELCFFWFSVQVMCFLVLTPIFLFLWVWVQTGSHSVPCYEPQLWFLGKKNLNKENAIMAKCLWLLSVEWLDVGKKALRMIVLWETVSIQFIVKKKETSLIPENVYVLVRYPEGWEYLTLCFDLVRTSFWSSLTFLVTEQKK